MDATLRSADDPPQVAWISPAGGTSFELGEALTLCAQVSDEDTLEDLGMTLTSTVDGTLWIQDDGWTPCAGGNLGLLEVLSPADHELVLSVVDPRGQAGQASLELAIAENGPPWCTLHEPVDGLEVELGGAVTVSAQVGDTEVDPAELAVSLESDLDGLLWSGTPDSSGDVSRSWTPRTSGTHQLVLAVEDPRGLLERCEATVIVDPCLDADADGVTTCEGDCDDTDDTVFPDATEEADGVDDDCDGDIDEGTVLGDDDFDGWTEVDGDCDDDDATVNPDATEVPYDGIDQDCDGSDDDDLDGDGYTASEADGPDCDDSDPAVNPGATETWYDGIDQDCDGANDLDADADTYDSDDHGGDDCDDTDPAIHPGAGEVYYDGIDQDCDGGSDLDADGDGHDSDAHGGDDCDDTRASVHPGASETWYDGIDGDCDGDNDYDADGDGALADTAGGSDCDDTDAGVNPSASETWYDGVDADCDGWSDYDADGDSHDSDAWGGDDCDDSDPMISPSATETWYDGIDSDCDGWSDDDADGDGHDSAEWGGGDCDDGDATVSPSATEVRDGQDNDCNDACDEGLIGVGDLVITELMKDPTEVSDADGEWFELHNPTSVDVLLCADWTFADDDSDSFTLASGITVLVPAGGYAVLSRETDPGTNGGVPSDHGYATGMQLGNGADEVVLLHGGVEIDRIEYDDGVDWPDPTGLSISLSPTALDASQNDDGASWCSASSVYGDGDKGTPGAANDGC